MIPGPPARGCEIWYWDMTIEDMGTCFLYSRAPAQRWGLVMHLPGAQAPQLGVQSKNGSPQVLARTWVPNPEGLWVFANAFFSCASGHWWYISCVMVFLENMANMSPAVGRV